MKESEKFEKKIFFLYVNFFSAHDLITRFRENEGYKLLLGHLKRILRWLKLYDND